MKFMLTTNMSWVYYHEMIVGNTHLQNMSNSYIRYIDIGKTNDTNTNTYIHTYLEFI